MDLSYYRGLLQQTARLEAFRRALCQVVGPGDRVLEVGAGVGAYAFFAARAGAGAGEVWACEQDPVLHVAEDVARTNGVHGIRWVRGRIPGVTLPGPADVVVFEDFGPRLLDPAMWALYHALHERYVGDASRFVPARAELRVAPADLPGLLALPEGDAGFGLRWDALRPYLANQARYDLASPDRLLGPAAAICSVDFSRDPDSWSVGGTARCTVRTPGTVSAVACWHALELAEGIVLDNAPGAQPASWGHVVLPCDPPIPVAAGAELAIEVRWDRDATGAPAWLAWRVTAGDVHVARHELAGFPASRADLAARTPEARPVPTERGRLMRDVLALADGTRSARAIAEGLATSYPAMRNADLETWVMNAVAEGYFVPEPGDG